VMLARPLLADPHWPRKVFAGRVGEIIPCIGDQEACINEFIHGGHPQCAVNPRTGFEEQLPGDVLPASDPRRIAVVGAGPAGVLCACLAAQRGHDVTLFERRDRAGGTLIPGSRSRIKFDVANYVEYLRERLDRCSSQHRLSVRFNTEATVDLLREGGFDALVLCTGARPKVPPVEGIDLPHVVQAVDLLWNPAVAEGTERAVVVGGGDVGCEVAHFLACECGKTVTVIEMLPYFMKDSCTANRGYLIHYLEEKGVALWNCTQLRRVDEHGVTVVRNVSPSVPSPYVTWAAVLPENVVNPLARPIRVREEEITAAADLMTGCTRTVSGSAWPQRFTTSAIPSHQPAFLRPPRQGMR
jgi:2-enoate reductase